MVDKRGTPSVTDMVRLYLVDHGFDGLYSYPGECGCELDDLAPCPEGPQSGCIAAYKRLGCSKDCGMGCKWHVVQTKPKAKKKKAAKKKTKAKKCKHDVQPCDNEGWACTKCGYRGFQMSGGL